MPTQKKNIIEWEKKLTRCHDCEVLLGEVHHDGCDVEECPKCHRQLIGCDCVNPWKSYSDRVKFGDETRNDFTGENISISSLLTQQHEADMERVREATRSLRVLEPIDDVSDIQPRQAYMAGQMNIMLRLDELLRKLESPSSSQG